MKTPLEPLESTFEIGEHRYRIISHEPSAEHEGIPLIVNMGLGTTAMTAVGQLYLGAFAEGASRPVVTLHPETRNWKSLKDRAETDAELLSGFDTNVDLLGISAGGLLAARVAGALGERASHLITVAAVGTLKRRSLLRGVPVHLRDGAISAEQIRRQGVDVKLLGKYTSNLFRPGALRQTIQEIRQMCGDTLQSAIDELSPKTEWISLVGTRDYFTDYRVHSALVDARNQLVPGSSKLIVEDGHGHIWSADRGKISQLAESVLVDQS